MKSYQLTLLALLINSLAFGQIEKIPFAEKKQFVLDVSGQLHGGRNLQYSIGPTPPKPFESIAPYAQQSDYVSHHAYQLLASVGYMVTDRLLVSLGVNYVETTAWGRTDNILQRRDDNSLLSGNGERYFNYSSTLPFIDVRYFYPLSNKLFFAPSLQFSSGTQHYNHHEYVSFMDYPASGLDAKHTIVEARLENDSPLISIQVSPTLYYKATKWLGVKMALGGFTFRHDKAFSVLPNQYSFSVNPSTWQLGVYSNFRLPRKL